MRQLESDWFFHQRPVILKGGKVIKFDSAEEVYAAIQINVASLGEIQPFTRYKLAVRRHIPLETLGLPLKFKVVGNVPFNPAAYVGFTREVFNNDGIEVNTGDLLSTVPEDHGNHGFEDEERPMVIEREVLAEMFPAVMFGFGNTATMDDVMSHGNEPRPFIDFYVNDEGRFVIMNCAEPRRRHPQTAVIIDREITTMPFTAKTLEVVRNQTEFTRPHSHRSGELFVQGGFNHGHLNRGHNGARGF